MDLIIIGSGPAGVSASLYAARAGLDVYIISGGRGALDKADVIENYYGFSEGISAQKLYCDGLAGAERLGVKTINAQVTDISYDGENFTVTSTAGEHTAKSVILATGASRLLPAGIAGIDEHIGAGVSFCAVCDAFFVRGKDTAVIGSGEYAAHEAGVLANVCKSVTVLTDGKKAETEFPAQYKIINDKITSIDGKPNDITVTFSDGGSAKFAAVFVAVGTAGAAALAKKLGALTDGNNISVDKNMHTNIDGLFAAGDCAGGLLQIAKAVYEGAVAGLEAVKFIKSKR